MREVEHAEEEGVEFVWLTAPEAYLGDDVVRGVRAVRIRLGAPDATGRQTPEIVEGSSHQIEADLVIKALGFDPEDLPTLFGEPGLSVTGWGTVGADFKTKMTNLDGVFAAGDIVRGASLVVWAVRDGRDAAASIHSFLQDRVVNQSKEPVRSERGGSNDKGKDGKRPGRRRVRQSVV